MAVSIFDNPWERGRLDGIFYMRNKNAVETTALPVKIKGYPYV